MAFPFGEHPKLGDYIAQAKQDHDAKAETLLVSDSSGKMHTAIKISVSSGKHVFVTDVDQSEHLAPMMVGYLDRKLGIESPYYSVDPIEDEE